MCRRALRRQTANRAEASMHGTRRIVPNFVRWLAHGIFQLGCLVGICFATEQYADVNVEDLRNTHEPGRTDASCALFEKIDFDSAGSDQPAELGLRQTALKPQNANS
jgi:hypothetical protein